ncbi:MAG TPA: DinB family protein [Acidimicrobiales bacterium]|nr:DinB family protein [Acidimicrobiales bacterium]
MRCEECGFTQPPDDAAIAAGFAGFPRRYRAPLTRFLRDEDGAAILRRRPAPGVWSALEYAAHTRDAIGFYRDRINLVLDTDRPQLATEDFAAVTEARRYHDEDPANTADGIEMVCVALNDRLSRLDAEQWDRVGIGSADGGEDRDRTVRVLAVRALHEGHHHLLDIGRVLRAAREA